MSRPYDDHPYRRAAELSDDGTYRWELTRWWSDPGAFLQRALTFVMLNPSTADADRDDPTVRACVKLAKREGLDGLRVVNLYAWRTSSPAQLFAAERAGYDTVGGANLSWLARTLVRADQEQAPVVAAWGNHAPAERAAELVELARGARVQLQCLGTTASGAPKHPLARGRSRIADDQPLLPWPAA